VAKLEAVSEPGRSRARAPLMLSHLRSFSSEMINVMVPIPTRRFIGASEHQPRKLRKPVCQTDLHITVCSRVSKAVKIEVDILWEDASYLRVVFRDLGLQVHTSVVTNVSEHMPSSKPPGLRIDRSCIQNSLHRCVSIQLTTIVPHVGFHEGASTA
jgi:hypothetical protein